MCRQGDREILTKTGCRGPYGRRYLLRSIPANCHGLIRSRNPGLPNSRTQGDGFVCGDRSGYSLDLPSRAALRSWRHENSSDLAPGTFTANSVGCDQEPCRRCVSVDVRIPITFFIWDYCKRTELIRCRVPIVCLVFGVTGIMTTSSRMIYALAR